MRLDELRPSAGARKDRKRVGRGPGSGHGKTACRGAKGQKSRSGGSVAPGFEGGQMPLQRRLPKRGFKNIFREDYAVVNLRDLVRCRVSDSITPDVLKDAGIIKKADRLVKVLGVGEIQGALTICAHKVSKTARQKIEQAGGRVEVISGRPPSK